MGAQAGLGLAPHRGTACVSWKVSRPSSHPRRHVAAPQNLAVVKACLTPGSRPGSSEPLLSWDKAATKLSKTCRLQGRAKPRALGGTSCTATGCTTGRSPPASSVGRTDCPSRLETEGLKAEAGYPIWGGGVGVRGSLQTAAILSLPMGSGSLILAWASPCPTHKRKP